MRRPAFLDLTGNPVRLPVNASLEGGLVEIGIGRVDQSISRRVRRARPWRRFEPTCRRWPTTIHALAGSFAALNLKKCPILLTFAVLKTGNLHMENTEPTRAGAESRAR